MTPPKTAEEEPLSRDMGLGRLGSPNIVFGRKFRWTLIAESIDGTENLPEWFQTKIKIDFYHNKLYFESYETICPDNILKWVESVKANPDKKRWLVLTTYDGLGHVLYTYQFHGINIGEREVDYDYESSDVITQKITVYFSDYSLTQTDPPVQETKRVNKPDWRISFIEDDNHTKEIQVNLDPRPSLEIEETEIKHLNTRAWIPGKAKWHEMAIGVQVSELNWFLSNLGLSKLGCKKMLLSLYRDNKKLEGWLLEGFSIHKMEPLNKDEQKITIKVDSFTYTNS